MKYVKKAQKAFAIAGERTNWAYDKKQEALRHFLSCGNKTQTAMDLRIPVKTIYNWSIQDWWRDGLKELKHENIDRTDAKLTALIDEALVGIEDRMSNGETVYDPRTGKERIVPVKIRDLNTVFTTLLDKRQLLRKEPTKIIEQTTTATQLQNLALQFEQFVTKRIKEERPEDIIEFIEGDTLIENKETGEWHVK